MPLPVKRCSVLAFVFACLALTSSIAIAAAEWQVIKVSGHDYLSVDNISKFYGLNCVKCYVSVFQQRPRIGRTTTVTVTGHVNGET